MIKMNNPCSGDQSLINKLTDIVLANISREDFYVEELAREAGMSRSSIHRKLKDVIDQNASQFIREIRLKKAMEMLQQGLGTASEIAYKVGFGSPAYFTKCFHEYYGHPPGEVKKGSPGEEDDAVKTDSNEHGIAKYDGREGDITQIGQQEAERKIAPERVKNRKISMIVVVVALVIVALASAVMLSDLFSRTSKKQSIVVLPFKNFSNDPGNQYFADGVMEDILNNLYHISNLRVISRTTSERFRDTNLTSKEIAQKLKIRNVLEGSMRREGNMVRISVQLIDASRDQHLWSENYDRETTHMLGVQGEIAMKIAERLKAVLTDSELRKLKEIPTKSPEAYDYYLRARFLLHKANSNQRFDISREGLIASLQYYENAIAADTNFVEAYAGLANAWFNLSAWGWYQPYSEGISNARYFSAKALEKDPDCAEAHAVRGVFLTYPDCNFEESIKELQTSIRLNPNFSTSRQWYAQILMITGPIEEARVQIDRAVELEPYFWVVLNLNSWIYYFEEKYDKGLEACLAARDLNPADPDNSWLFVLHSIKLGEGEKAAKELHDRFNRNPGTLKYADEVTEAYNKSGSEGIFKWLIDVNLNNPIPAEGLNGSPFYLSWWYAILGDREQSIYWLEKTIEGKNNPRHYFNLITTNPDFDILRSDPRFTAVLEKSGLSAYNKRSAR